MEDLAYAVWRRKADFEGTVFIELAPGRFKGEHWADGSLFVDDDGFSIASNVVRRHFAYDPCGPNDIPKEAGMRIVNDWNAAADALENGDIVAADRILVVSTGWLSGWGHDLQAQAPVIARMLRELAREVAGYYETNDWVAILGL